ncbi:MULTISPECIES: hypothetical protein [unclassified Nostoc]|uniref:hypothetical protein n=1 Tax=unclassified Nostoc TaxID=2593658 RepID=UPI002AD2D52C|nr:MULTISPECIES: hypothetical protein [unclassified Nostoc]MDZ8121019.1 hypothetical protein [Nostoc sp. CmiVER01]MDZ8223743.1 hypothetical protein [Nostoc sp. ChiVER01]
MSKNIICHCDRPWRSCRVHNVVKQSNRNIRTLAIATLRVLQRSTLKYETIFFQIIYAFISE